MIEVTDEMVDTAWDVWRGPRTVSRKDVRNMIEAALAKRKHDDAGEFVEELKGYVQSTCKCPLDKCADAIEELVEALKPFAALHVDDSDYSDTDISTYEGNVLTASCVRNARSILTRMGVKL